MVCGKRSFNCKHGAANERIEHNVVGKSETNPPFGISDFSFLLSAFDSRFFAFIRGLKPLWLTEGRDVLIPCKLFGATRMPAYL